jgi:hypothetical protein
MIRVEETKFTDADVRRIEKQVKFLEQKAAERHWPKFIVRPCITLAVVAVIYAFSQSQLLSIIIFVVGAGWTGAVFDAISTQKANREWLEYEKSRLETPVKTEITVENCDYIDYGEVEDEGVLFLFGDDANNWLLLEGQVYYPSEKFPSSSFRLSYDSRGALMEINSKSPSMPPKKRYDSRVKMEKELNFSMIDHAIVQAKDEDEAIAKLQAMADEMWATTTQPIRNSGTV